MAHTVQLCYFMSYTAHFFALILPRKVQYMPNQVHNCTVQLCYFMNYRAYFFAVILPRKVQYVWHNNLFTWAKIYFTVITIAYLICQSLVNSLSQIPEMQTKFMATNVSTCNFFFCRNQFSSLLCMVL